MPRWTEQLVAICLALCVLAVVVYPFTNLAKTALRGKALANQVFDQLAMAIFFFVCTLLAVVRSALLVRHDVVVPLTSGHSLLELNCVRRC